MIKKMCFILTILLMINTFSFSNSACAYNSISDTSQYDTIINEHIEYLNMLENDNFSYSSIVELYSINNYVTALYVELCNNGYVIINLDTNEIAEYSLYTRYSIDNRKKYIYIGALSIYENTGNKYVNILTKEVVPHNYLISASKSNNTTFSPNTRSITNSVYSNASCKFIIEKGVIDGSTVRYDCNNEYAMINYLGYNKPGNDKYSINKAKSGGVCGSVAASIVLHYLVTQNKINNFPISKDTFNINRGSGLFGIDVVKKLEPYIEKGKADSVFLSTSLDSYFDSIGWGDTLDANMVVTQNSIENKIRTYIGNRSVPVICGLLDHWIVIEGYTHTYATYLSNGNVYKDTMILSANYGYGEANRMVNISELVSAISIY